MGEGAAGRGGEGRGRGWGCFASLHITHCTLNVEHCTLHKACCVLYVEVKSGLSIERTQKSDPKFFALNEENRNRRRETELKADFSNFKFRKLLIAETEGLVVRLFIFMRASRPLISHFSFPILPLFPFLPFLL